MLEVCVDSIESVQAAVSGGAHRLELCSALSEGGLTPTVGLMRAVKSKFPAVPVYAMLRPTNRNDYIVTDDEMEIIRFDMELLRENGADGFVFGALTEDRRIDVAKCNEIVGNANDLPVTFHRAFDETRPEEKEINLKVIQDAGFSRILTSGYAETAERGLSELSDLCSKAERLTIMPGCGITDKNANEILTETKSREFHASARIRKSRTLFVADEKQVKLLVDIGRNYMNS